MGHAHINGWVYIREGDADGGRDEGSRKRFEVKNRK